MSLAVRVIPCLDVDAGRVVKGVHFENLRDAGDPVELAAEYYRQGADELTFLDVTASSSHRQTMVDVVSLTAEQIFIPLTVGGGVRTLKTSIPCFVAVRIRSASTPRPSMTLPHQSCRRTIRQSGACAVRRCTSRTGRTTYAVRFRSHHHGRAQIHWH